MAEEMAAATSGVDVPLDFSLFNMIGEEITGVEMDFILVQRDIRR